jgi:hypothetical protein
VASSTAELTFGVYNTPSTEALMAMPKILRSVSKGLGLGPVVLRYYHTPLGRLRQSIAEGGPLEQHRTEQARREMIAAAKVLPPLTARHGQDTVEIAFLSGQHFWWQTLFCVVSLQTHCPARIMPVVYDDGTFNEVTWSAFSRVVPWARLVDGAQIEARLDAHLPFSRFPALRSRRLSYPHLRKLTDIHVGRSGWLAVLDSDMLFFRPPKALLGWLAAPDRPCCLVEETSAYGYSPRLMRELAGDEPPACVNVGVCGLRSDTIDWDRLEYWCREMLEREGTHYFQEQALTAMLLTGQECHRFGPPDYVVMPSLAEGRRPAAALHHYVSNSKRSYFQHGWRRALADSMKGQPQ